MADMIGYTAFLSTLCLSLTSFICIIVIYCNSRQHIIPHLHSFPITEAFKQTETITISLSCTVFVTVPIAFELALDFYLKWQSSVLDRGERLVMIIYAVAPGLALIINQDCVDAPYLFACLHATQYVGLFGAILSLCNKLVPDYFAARNIIVIHFFFSAGSIFSMMAFGYDHLTWRDYLMLICVATSLLKFSYFAFTWIRSLKITSTNSFRALSINQFSCLLYLLTTYLTIIALPGLAASIYLFSWQKFDLPVVLVFIYGVAGFSLIPSCVPGRIARYSFMLSSSKAAIEHEIKWAILRYLSHELRSPLNVICSSVKFAMEEVNLSNSSQLENLTDIYVASENALGILDDIMSFELGENGLLDICLKFVAFSRVQKLMECALCKHARNRKIQLSNNIDVKFQSLYTELGLFLDERHIEQLFRNILTVLSTYSAENSYISISIRLDENFAPLASCGNGTDTAVLSSSLSFPCKAKYHPGVFRDPPQFLRGISPDISAKNWSLNQAEYQSISNGFMELAFSANCKYIPALALYNSNPTELELLSTDKLEGGGGVGLKLRVAQSVVQSHQGVLSVNLEEKGPDGFHRASIRVCLPIVQRVVATRDSIESFLPHQDSNNLCSGQNGNIDYRALRSEQTFLCRLGSQVVLDPGVPTVDSPARSLAQMESPQTRGIQTAGYEGAASKFRVDSERGQGRDDSEKCRVDDNEDEDEDQVKSWEDEEGVRALFTRRRSSVPLSARISERNSDFLISSVPRMLRYVPATAFGSRSKQVVCSGIPLEDVVAEEKSVSSRCLGDPPKATALLRKQGSTSNVRIRVLVVDDSELNRKVMKRSVELLAMESVQLGVVFSIDQCDDGVTACEFVTRTLEMRCPYDLVLMDNIMCHMNGPEAAETMRRVGYLGRIVGVTGNVMAKDVKRFVESGADCVLAKPLDMDRLREVVSRVVEIAIV